MAPQVICVLTLGPGEQGSAAATLAALRAQQGGPIVVAAHGPVPHIPPPDLAADPRVRWLTLGPCARATAINRAMALALTIGPDAGWVWTLAPGDRPAPFAMALLADRIGNADPEARPDLLLLPGVWASPAPPPLRLPGQDVLRTLERDRYEPGFSPLPAVQPAWGALLISDPAMRLISVRAIRRGALRAADDQGEGAAQLCTGALLAAQGIARIDVPVFARPAPDPDPAPGRTHDPGLAAAAAHAALRDTGRALDLLGRSWGADDPDLRLALLAGLGLGLAGFARTLPETAQGDFRHHRDHLIRRIDQRLHWSLDPDLNATSRERLGALVPWLDAGLAALSGD